MKLLFISGSEEIYGRICRPIGGNDLIWYRDIFKAMDNIEEIAPDGVIIDAADFPRHWKTFVQFSKHVGGPRLYIIVFADNFLPQDRVKARFLGVAGFSAASLTHAEGINRFKQLLSRFAPPSAKSLAARRAQAFPLSMVITNPFTGAFVTGRIKKISLSGVTFAPDHTRLLRGLKPGAQLSNQCSLRVGDRLLKPVCKVEQVRPYFSLSFVSFPGEERTALRQYLYRRLRNTR